MNEILSFLGFNPDGEYEFDWEYLSSKDKVIEVNVVFTYRLGLRDCIRSKKIPFILPAMIGTVLDFCDTKELKCDREAAAKVVSNMLYNYFPTMVIEKLDIDFVVKESVAI